METTLNITDDAELAILEHIYASQKRSRSPTQRDLATVSGLSLGMTNALLKRFSDKGWVMLQKLNARTIRYALTPEGVNEIAHRTYRYFRRTARAAGLYRDIIEEYVMRIKRDGATRLVLAGVSDIDFLVEYACERHGLLFIKSADPVKAEKLGRDSGTVLLWSDDATDGVPGRAPDRAAGRSGQPVATDPVATLQGATHGAAAASGTAGTAGTTAAAQSTSAGTPVAVPASPASGSAGVAAAPAFRPEYLSRVLVGAAG